METKIDIDRVKQMEMVMQVASYFSSVQIFQFHVSYTLKKKEDQYMKLIEDEMFDVVKRLLVDGVQLDKEYVLEPASVKTMTRLMFLLETDDDAKLYGVIADKTKQYLKLTDMNQYLERLYDCNLVSQLLEIIRAHGDCSCCQRPRSVNLREDKSFTDHIVDEHADIIRELMCNVNLNNIWYEEMGRLKLG